MISGDSKNITAFLIISGVQDTKDLEYFSLADTKISHPLHLEDRRGWSWVNSLDNHVDEQVLDIGNKTLV